MKRQDVFPSRWLKASDLEGKKCRAIMRVMEMQEITEGEGEKPILYFKRAQNDAVKNKGLVLNGTNWDLIEAMYGDSDDWEDKEITLYPTKVTFRGKLTDAIRIEFNHAAPITKSATAKPKSIIDERNPPDDVSTRAAALNAEFNDEVPW
jgi:hypothetical protein